MQEQVEAIAPQGWTLSLDGFSLGNVAPTISGWQVYNDTVTGEVESLTADLVLESTSLSVSLTGSGPLVGKFVGARAASRHPTQSRPAHLALTAAPAGVQCC